MVRWTRSFIPTLRESPAGVESAAERLLVRAGFVRAVSTGVYGYLPLGARSLARLAGIAREELAAAGGQEIVLDAAAAAEIARGELRSPKQLPQIWYRVETPLLRARQFAGLDVYWFGDAREAVEGALRRIAGRAGVAGEWSRHGAVVLDDAGADLAAACSGCGAAAPAGLADSVPQAAPPDPEGELSPEPFPTPGQKTIADIARFTGRPEAMQMKSLVLVANGKPVLVLLRGDHQLSHARFTAVSGDPNFRPAAPEELVKWFGASAGSLGPIGAHSVPVWMDRALEGRRNMVCGANRDDFHLRHVTPGKDFQAEIFDLRETAAGDACPSCGAPLAIRAAVDLARIYGSGARLSLERLLTRAADAGHDADGMVLPRAIAPFDVIVTDAGAAEAALSVCGALSSAGFDVLLDDRDERAGVKFKDADLIGVPWRVTAGRKAVDGIVEVVERRARTRTDVPLAGVADYLREACSGS